MSDVIVVAIGLALLAFWIFGLLAHLGICGEQWFHDHMGQHKPVSGFGFDGCTITSRCRFCNLRIGQDSQGNWFTFMRHGAPDER